MHQREHRSPSWEKLRFRPAAIKRDKFLNFHSFFNLPGWACLIEKCTTALKSGFIFQKVLSENNNVIILPYRIIAHLEVFYSFLNPFVPSVQKRTFSGLVFVRFISCLFVPKSLLEIQSATDIFVVRKRQRPFKVQFHDFW